VWYFGTKSSTFDTNVFYDHDIFCVCFNVMYSGEYNVIWCYSERIYPHPAGWKLAWPRTHTHAQNICIHKFIHT
jgi:hypothetical protein